MTAAELDAALARAPCATNLMSLLIITLSLAWHEKKVKDLKAV